MSISTLFKATHTSWLAATHGKTPADEFSINIFNHWWARDLVCSVPSMPDPKAATAEFLKLAKVHGIGKDTEWLIAKAGETRTHLRQDVFSDCEWKTHWKRIQFHLPCLEIDERMQVVYTLNPYAESYFLIDRAPGQPPFSEQDRLLATLLTSGLASFHRKLFLYRGFLTPASKAHSPREKQVFSLLFSDLTEIEIANEVGISKHTAHQYIRNLYKNYGVNSRSAFLAANI